MHINTDMLFVCTKFSAYLTNIVHLFTYPSLEMGQAYEVWPENSVTVFVTQLNVKSSYTVSNATLHILHTATLAIILFVQAFHYFSFKTAFTSNVKLWFPSFSTIYLNYGSSYMSQNTVMIQSMVSVQTVYSNIFSFYQLAYATGAAYICINSIQDCFTTNLWQILGPTFLSGWWK